MPSGQFVFKKLDRLHDIYETGQLTKSKRWIVRDQTRHGQQRAELNIVKILKFPKIKNKPSSYYTSYYQEREDSCCTTNSNDRANWWQDTRTDLLWQCP